MNPNSVYTQIFSNALKTTWRHKLLWLIGIPASFMVSGGLLEVVSGNWQAALRGRILIEQTINGALPGYDWFVSYSRYLGVLSPVHQYTILTIIVFVFLVTVIIGAICQGAVFSGALEKHPLGLRELIKKGLGLFDRILGLDILAKLAIFVIFLVIVAPVAFLNPLPYSWHKFPPVISLIIFAIGALIITSLQMLAIGGVVRKQLNVRAATAEAWSIFRLHVLTTIEIGVLLFLVSIVVAVIAGLVFTVLAIPLTLLFVLATTLQIPTLYVLAIVVSFATAIAVGLLASGFTTTFQYTVWSLYFEEAGRFGIFSKIRKWLRV